MLIKENINEKEYMNMIIDHVKDFIKNNNVLISYLRKPGKYHINYHSSLAPRVEYHKGEIIGTVIATDKDTIGWSKLKKGDRYNKYLGIYEAILHAEANTPPCQSMEAVFEKMKIRAAKYFK